MFEGSPDREWEEGEDRTNKLVFIGRDIDMELLREGFEECLSDESLNAAAGTLRQDAAPLA